MSSARIRVAFLNACALDVAVRKPGNVSRASPGHGMHAELFIESAREAADPLVREGARVGERIEGAVLASLAVAGCNTNLGIVLLAAPMARAAEFAGPDADAATMRTAVEAVLADLDLDDARAAYRAIAAARPGGLGRTAEEDVLDGPTLDLRRAMALAADRDLIARQYATGFADLFAVALGESGLGFVRTFATDAHDASAPLIAAVQRTYLLLLSRFPDSHIVRKHGEAVAQTVMSAAHRWYERAVAGERLDTCKDFVAWDEALKAQSVNPGTTADLTVAALMLVQCLRAGALPS